MLAEIGIKVRLEILFLSLGNVDLEFSIKKLIKRLYTTAKVLSTVKKFELINKHKFVKAVLNKKSNIFLIDIAILGTLKLVILTNLLEVLLLASLQSEKALSKIAREYVEYPDVFSPDLAMEVLENIRINKYSVELLEGKQLLYRLIYSLSSVKLKILKTYIKTHFKAGFILFSKSLAGGLILLYKKLDDGLQLCIDY